MARLASGFAPDHTALLYSMCLHGRAELALAPDEYGRPRDGAAADAGFRSAPGPRPAQKPTRRRSTAPSNAPAAGPRPAIALQLPTVAKAAVAVGAGRAVARPSLRRAELGCVARRHRRSRSADIAAAHIRRSAATRGRLPGRRWSHRGSIACGEDSLPEPYRAVSRAGDRSRSCGACTRPELGSRWAAAVDALIADGSIGALTARTGMAGPMHRDQRDPILPPIASRLADPRRARDAARAGTRERLQTCAEWVARCEAEARSRVRTHRRHACAACACCNGRSGSARPRRSLPKIRWCSRCSRSTAPHASFRARYSRSRPDRVVERPW